MARVDCLFDVKTFSKDSFDIHNNAEKHKHYLSLSE